MRLLLDSVPTLALPPLGLPQPGSSNELILFRLFVLELLAYSMDVRRAIIFGKRKGHPKTTHIALAVFRYPEDIEQATYDLAQLAGRYDVVLLVPYTRILPFTQWLLLDY